MNEVSTGIKCISEQMAQDEYYQTAFMKEKDALKEMDDKTLVIVVDTHRTSMVEGPSVLEAAKKIVVFDHHRKSAQDFIEQAVLLYHEPYASSTSELITEMIQHIGKRIKLRSIEADALLAGITVDTKNSQSKRVRLPLNPQDFCAATGQTVSVCVCCSRMILIPIRQKQPLCVMRSCILAPWRFPYALPIGRIPH